jgi:hypothetical protein
MVVGLGIFVKDEAHELLLYRVVLVMICSLGEDKGEKG